jgi:hypothetical protein
MIAAKVASSGALAKIAQDWRMPTELAADLVQLALWDVVLYVDGKYRFRVTSSKLEVDVSSKS